MKWLVGTFLFAAALAITFAFARDVTSKERQRLDGVITAYYAQSGNESRTVPIPGDAAVRLDDGRTLRLGLRTADDVKPGTRVKVSEMIAPWGAVWYRLAND